MLFGALRRLGAVQNPILPIYREREVGFIIRQAGSALLVVPSTWKGFDYEAMAADVTAGTDTQVLVSDRSLPDGDPATLPPPPDDDMHAPTGQPVPVRFLYYTSGTTADPKGARHADRSLMSASVGMSERLGLADDDRFALVFPFTHIAGGVYIYAAVAYGLTFVLDEAFDPATTLTLLRREDITQGGAGTLLPPDVPRRPSRTCRRARSCSPASAPSPAAAPRSRPACTTSSRRRSASAWCRATA